MKISVVAPEKLKAHFIFLTDQKTSAQSSYSSYMVNSSAEYSNLYCSLSCFHNLEKGHKLCISEGKILQFTIVLVLLIGKFSM